MILTGSMRNVTRSHEMPPLELRASFTPGTVDAERRTVQMTWTTGAAVLRGGLFTEPYYEELSLQPSHVRMARLKSGAAPLLDSHNAERVGDVIGVVESAQLEPDAGRGTATVRFDRGDAGEDAFRKVSDGILRNVSVGYRVFKMTKVDPGDEAKKKPPTYRAVDWEPHELSMTPIGADAGATTRAAHAGGTNPCEIEERTMEGNENPAGGQPGATESAAAAATRAAREARVAHAQEIALAQEEASAAAIAKERVRSAEIRKIAAVSKLGEAWAQALIEAGTTIDAAREAAFNDITAREREFSPNSAVRIGAGDDERDKWIRGASAWLIERTGYTEMVQRGQKALPNHKVFKDISFDPGEFRGMSPSELARQSLERNRFDTRGMDVMDMVGHAFLHKRNPGSFQTTSDFAILLENVVNKVSLGAYATQDNTWQRFCKSTDVKDFRSSPQYRTGSLPNLDSIAEHGEYHSGAIPDGAKYQIATGRLGKKFSLSREVIVNDDMGAVLQTAEQFGAASMRTIETSVYALLLANAGLGPSQADTNPFFHASRSNVSTGSALSVSGIDGDRVTLRAQKDPSGNDFLDLRPAVLLVPDSLYGQASVINDAQYDTDRVANGRQQEPNRVRGLFRDVVGTPRLTSTRRYVFATTMDAIVVAFLLGYGRAPNIETMNGWNVDGVEWKVTLYAKAQMGDPKSALTNAGA